MPDSDVPSVRAASPNSFVVRPFFLALIGQSWHGAFTSIDTRQICYSQPEDGEGGSLITTSWSHSPKIDIIGVLARGEVSV